MKQAIDSHARANAAWMEHQILDHVKQALRVTLAWQVPSVGLPRKLSSVQFTLKSLQRHLERMMQLEEEDGYMVTVAEMKPNLCFRIERLEKDHAAIRRNLHELVPEVESLSEFQSEQFGNACNKIVQLLELVDRHDTEEVELLQETLLFDEGGEG